MKKKLLSILFGFLFLIILSKTNLAVTIVIDPGHRRNWHRSNKSELRSIWKKSSMENFKVS